MYCTSSADEVSFEWSHHSISSTDSEVRITLTLSLPESVMETPKVILTSESVDKILWCDHSNETFSAVLSRGPIYILGFYKNNIWDSSWILILATLGSERVKVGLLNPMD